MSSSPAAFSSSPGLDLCCDSLYCTSHHPHSEDDIQELHPSSSTPDLSSDSPQADQDCTSTGSDTEFSSDDDCLDQSLSVCPNSVRSVFSQRTSSDNFTKCLDVLLLDVLRARELGQEHCSYLPNFSLDRNIEEDVNPRVSISCGRSELSGLSEIRSPVNDNRSSSFASSSSHSGENVLLFTPNSNGSRDHSRTRLHATSGSGAFSYSESLSSVNDYSTNPGPLTASHCRSLRRVGHFRHHTHNQRLLHTESVNSTIQAHTSTQERDGSCMLKAGASVGGKRSRSFFIDEVTNRKPSSMVPHSFNLTSPPHKKQKRNRHVISQSSRSLSLATVPSRHFAKGPASLRRAQSLKSDADCSFTPDNKENHTPIVRLNSISHLGFQLVPGSPLIDTVPTTPLVHLTGGSRTLRRQPVAPQRHSSCFLPPVPIIAPPLLHLIPLPPLSEEDRAELRLKRFLVRESHTRTRDGLDAWYKASVCGKFLIMSEEDVLGLEFELERRKNEIDILRRREIIEWILTVLPQPVAESPEAESDTDSEQEYESELNIGYAELYDQLVTSPETRFHAAYLFTRYFSCVLDEGNPEDSGRCNLGLNDEATFQELRHGMALVKWDVAVGCLALSVKYHRDFLPPLNPIFAFDFLLLAPHSISYDDLETTQRDILSAISYTLGDTPQSVLDEVWLAVPILRQLLDFKGGWDIAKNETWLRLFDAVAESDILRFPISLLTASALAEGVIASLDLKYEFQAEEIRLRQEYTVRRWLRGSGPFPVLDDRKGSKLRKKDERMRRVMKEVEPVVNEIRRVLEVEEDDLMECRRWLCCVSDSQWS